jgi:hypothetical protein
MKEAHSEVFDFLIDHPTLSAVMNRMSKKFPAVPKPKQSIVSLERDDDGEEMNPLMRTSLERRQWDKIAVHHFDYMNKQSQYFRESTKFCRESFFILTYFSTNFYVPYDF